MTQAIYIATAEYTDEIRSSSVKRRVCVSGILKHLGVSRSGYNSFRHRHPSANGDTTDTLYQLEQGLIDFALLYIIPGTDISELNVIATYNLAYNASLMVKDGLGYAICFDSIINTNSDDNDSLCFIPLPELQIPLRPIVMWKKHQTLSKTAERFTDILRQVTV